MYVSAFPRWFSGKESTCQCRRFRRQGFNPWVRKIPWSRKWHPTLVFLLEKSHGQRSLAGYSPSGRKESDKTEHSCKHLFLTVRPLVNYIIPLSFWVFVYRLVVMILVQSSNTHVQLFATPWTVACQASLSFTISWSLLKFISVESVIPSNRLILLLS